MLCTKKRWEININPVSKAALLALSLIYSLVAHAVARTNEPIQPIEQVKPKSKEKVELGKKLFFDPRLSKSGTISCNSCHNLSLGGTDNLPTSIGHRWHIGPINSPTVLNAKYNVAQFWDGRAKDLVDQAAGPIANPGEMAGSHDLAISTLRSIPGYRTEFSKVYGPGDLTISQVQDAIAAFEETLITPNSRFDKWLKGNNKALNKAELQGYELFKSKGCISCHNGPAVGGGSFQKFGLVKERKSNSAANGRFDVTKNEADRNVFKVPTLRNIDLTYPYFHDGSVWDLREAVKVMAEVQLGTVLAEQEVDSIVAFLKTLTGDRLKISLPELPVSAPTSPTPVFN